MPNAPRSEVSKVLELQFEQLLPFSRGECVTGFRLGDKVSTTGRLAVVGAIKIDSLERALTDAKALGIRVRLVLPVAFGSWLLAKSQGQQTAAVVEINGELMSVDVIAEGELRHSRSLPTPESVAEIHDEIERTFTIAGIPAGPTIAAASPDVQASFRVDRPAISYLADPAAYEKQLFTFELPGRVQALEERAANLRAGRAIGAALVAVLLGSYVYNTKYKTHTATGGRSATLNRQMKAATTKRTSVDAKLATIANADQLLGVAFNPGQKVSDVVTVLSATAPHTIWFTNIVIGHHALMSVAGFATNDADISHLANDLSGDARFTEVKVVSASQTLIDKKPITDFTITGRVLGLLPFDRPNPVINPRKVVKQ